MDRDSTFTTNNIMSKNEARVCNNNIYYIYLFIDICSLDFLAKLDFYRYMYYISIGDDYKIHNLGEKLAWVTLIWNLMK